MTDVYLLNAARQVIGRLDPSFESLQTTRRYQGVSACSMTISRQVLYGDMIDTGTFLYLPDGNEVYQIEQVQSVQEGSERNDTMDVSGRSVEGFALQERRVIPPAGLDHDEFSGPAESAIKHFVNMHAGPGAIASRQVPNLVIIADAATGPVVDVQGRYQTVEDVVTGIGFATGLGWNLTLNPATRNFEFNTRQGRDLTTDVFFDFDFQTLEKWTELVSLIDSKTLAIVAGQGEGAAREIVVRWPDIDTAGPEPSGFDRREIFVDARDVAVGNEPVLNSRGDATIGALSPSRMLEATIHNYGSFQYRDDWQEGDTVLVRNAARGLSFAALVVDVTRNWSDSAVAPTITASLSRPLPTLKDKVAGSNPAVTIDYATGGGGGAAVGLVVDALGRLVTYASDTGLVTQ